VLFGRPEAVDRRGGDARVSAEPRGNAAARPGGGELLRPDRVVDVIASLAAELHRVLEAEEAELGGALEQLAGELARLLPGVEVGRDLLSHPPADGLPKLLVLVGEGRQERPLAGVPDNRQRSGARQPSIVV
jgi:hypothetical protein